MLDGRAGRRRLCPAGILGLCAKRKTLGILPQQQLLAQYAPHRPSSATCFGRSFRMRRTSRCFPTVCYTEHDQLISGQSRICVPHVYADRRLYDGSYRQSGTAECQFNRLFQHCDKGTGGNKRQQGGTDTERKTVLHGNNRTGRSRVQNIPCSQAVRKRISARRRTDYRSRMPIRKNKRRNNRADEQHAQIKLELCAIQNLFEGQD